jgi:type IV pilus assembly protein PilF
MKRFADLLAAGFTVTALAACSTTNPGHKEMSHAERAQKFVEIANGALNEGDPTGALQNLALAEREDGRLPELHHSKALAYYAKHDLQTAIAEARKAIELKADYPDAQNTLGKLLMDDSKAEEAIAPLTLAAGDPLYRESFKPLTNLGILYYRRGSYARSTEYLNRAIAAAPAAACVAHYYRGHISLRESRFQQAVKDYDAAGKRACGSFADAQLAMGIALERNQQFEQARKKYLEVEQRYPNTPVAEQAVAHLRALP